MMFERKNKFELTETLDLIKSFATKNKDINVTYYSVASKYGPIFLTEKDSAIDIILLDLSGSSSFNLNFSTKKKKITRCYIVKERQNSVDLEIPEFINELTKRIEGIDKIDCVRKKLEFNFISYFMTKFEAIHIYEDKYNYSEDITDPIQKKKQKEFDDKREHIKQKKIKDFENNLEYIVKNYSEPSTKNNLDFLIDEKALYYINNVDDIIEIFINNWAFKKAERLFDKIYGIRFEIVSVNNNEQKEIFLLLKFKNSL